MNEYPKTYHVSQKEWEYLAVPKTIKEIDHKISQHASERMIEKGIKPFNTISGNLFEITIGEKGHPIKFGVRTSYNSEWDLCCIVACGGKLITCWLNHKSDSHRTLDISKYCA